MAGSRGIGDGWRIAVAVTVLGAVAVVGVVVWDIVDEPPGWMLGVACGVLVAGAMNLLGRRRKR